MLTDEWLQAAAEEQGSASVEVLKQNRPVRVCVNCVGRDWLRNLRRFRKHG